MAYVITGVVCLMAGACLGVLITAIFSVNRLDITVTRGEDTWYADR